MTERHSIDKYSRTEYEEGLANISKKEAGISNHPLQKELELHADLKKSAGSIYPFTLEEQEVKIAFDNETAPIRQEIDQIKKNLWRQLSNAQTEALEIDAELESKKLAQRVLPQIAQIEDDAHHRLEDTRANLSPRAQMYGRAVIEVAEEAKYKIASQKPKPAPAMIRSIFQALQELSREFARQAGNVLAQDRYGSDATSSAIP